MKKILLPLIALAFATPATAQSIIVVTGPQADSTALPVAYAELRSGENHAAIAKLTGETNLAARDPSRLINRYVDSRWAARTARANLAAGRPLLALAR